MDSRKAIVFAEMEGTYAVAAVLAQAMLCKITDFSPQDSSMKEFDHAQSVYGSQKSFITSTFRKIGIEIELTGFGAAGTMPLHHPLFRCCGNSVIETADTDVAIGAVTDGHESATLGYHLDGMFFKMVGCRGTKSMTINPEGHLVVTFEIWGLPVDSTDTALPDVDLSGFLEPVPINDDTTTFTLLGYTPVLNSLSLSDGFEIVKRNKPGDKGIYLRNRKSTGSVQFDLPANAAHNFLADVRNHTTGALSVVVGTAAGNINTITAPNVQLINPTLNEVDNVVQFNASLKLIRNSDEGDDELVITQT